MNETQLALTIWREGGVVLLLIVVVGIIVFGALNRFAERAATQAFDKRLEDHKHELSLASAAAQLEHQRKLADFVQFTTQRHIIYPRIYRRLVMAEGLITRLGGGFGFIPNFTTYSLEDVDALAKELITTSEEMEEVRALWDEDRESGVKKLEHVFDQSRRRTAERSLNTFRNAQTLNELYYSDEVMAALNDAWMALTQLQVVVRYPEGVTAPSFADKRAAVAGAVQKVRTTMKAELAKGDYPAAG